MMRPLLCMLALVACTDSSSEPAARDASPDPQDAAASDAGDRDGDADADLTPPEDGGSADAPDGSDGSADAVADTGAAPELQPGVFVAIGDGWERAATRDGSEWFGLIYDGNPSGDGDVLRDVTFGAGMFLTADNAQRAYRSRDGRDWMETATSVDGSPGHSWMGGIVFADDGYFYGAGGNQRILRTRDGGTWEEVNSGRSPHFRTIAYGENMWVAAGDQGVLATSQDGENWRTEDVGEAGFQGAAYGMGFFVLVGHGAHVTILQRDGSRESFTLEGASDSLRDVVFGGDRFYVVGDESNATFDGSEWRVDSGGPSLVGVAYGVDDLGEPLVLAASRSGIFRTDDGLSWERVFDGVNQIRDIEFGSA